MPEPDGCQLKTSQRGPRRRCFIAPGTIRERAKEQWEDRMLTSTGHPRLRPAQSTMRICCDNRGQAVVEFTLCFILLLVIAWIPADFGLAFYTGQLALNASREGARVASATIPFDSTESTTQTCRRLSSAFLLDPGSAFGTSCSPYSQARVAVTAPTGVTCNQQLTVTVTGDYNYWFYGLLRFLGASVPQNVRITRSTQMRWEHQDPCT